MKKINYIDIFKQAFLIVWNNKVLWFFGFFLLSGSFSLNYNFDFNSIADNTSGIKIPQWLSFDSSVIIILVGILFFIFLALFIARILATASIIKMSNNISVYRNSSIRSVLKEIKIYFWTLLVIDLIFSFGLIFVLLLMLTPIIILFSMKAFILGGVASFAAVVILIPIIVLVYYLRSYAYMYTVIFGSSWQNSIGLGYTLFKENVKESLIMAIFSILASFTLWTCLLLAIIMLVVPVILLGGVILFLSKVAALIVVVLFAVGIIIFGIVVVSMMQAYSQVLWVLFFQQIAFLKSEDSIVVNNEAIELENVPDPEIA
jgi:hypothetical protein